MKKVGLLDELYLLTGYNRKYAARVLAPAGGMNIGKPPPGRPKPLRARGRKPTEFRLSPVSAS